MKRDFLRKSAQIAFVILLLCACVFFAYACEEDETVSAELGLSGDLYPGALLSVEVSFKGDSGRIAEYSSMEYLIEIPSGTNVASVEEDKIRISEKAKAGDLFEVCVTIGDLQAEKIFEVQAPPFESVLLVCPDRVEAGEVVTLDLETTPAEWGDYSPEYTLISGAASLEGNVLTVAEDADFGEILLRASIGGIYSEEKSVTITTVRTQSIDLTLSAATVLPGGTITASATTTPRTVSDPPVFSLGKGADIASIDSQTGVLRVSASAEMKSEIEIVVRSGSREAKATVTVDYPPVQSISVLGGGGSVSPGASKTFSYSVLPAECDLSQVSIRLVEGEEYVEWIGGTTFTVNADAPSAAQILFLLEASTDVYRVLTYTVGEQAITTLSIETEGSLSYLKSGDSLTFTHQIYPVGGEEQAVVYRATRGAELVTISGSTVTVRDGADMGSVTIVAECGEGVISNEIEFTVAGRYSRRAYSSWANVSLSSGGENACIWMVLPPVLNSGCLTVIVPSEVVDLVIEGRYDGTEQSAYRDLYFYFRNATERRVTFVNFATIATQGLGGTVMDLGSAGKTEIVLKGQNLIKADSPYRLDNTGEIKDGIWDTGFSYTSQETLRRSGKPGYRGTEGGTAIAGYELSFRGEGTLTAYAGSGSNGTAGGNGADAIYSDGVETYVSGAGGDGGAGGDSGAAIYAEKVDFASGLVTAYPGNAGCGGMGGAAGSLSDLIGRDVTMTSGTPGANGRDGIAYPAIRAKEITGTGYTNGTGIVESRDVTYDGVLANLAEKLSRTYGVSVYYGTSLYNPFKNLSYKKKYIMEQQLDYTTLMKQAQFLMYTLSQMPRNSLREVGYLSGSQVSIYLCKKITSGTGTNILGLTSEANRVWFATFETEVRGVYYGGYFNIMLHEFVHVFNYNLTATEQKNLASSVAAWNYGLSYKSTNSTERVYGVSGKYDETNSCFLSGYSRKAAMEDIAETVSVISTFSSLEPPLTEGTNIRRKYDFLVATFAAKFETLSAFATKGSLFAYRHLFDEA